MKALFQITPRGVLNLSLCFIMLTLASCASNTTGRNVAGEEAQVKSESYRKPIGTGRTINPY